MRGGESGRAITVPCEQFGLNSKASGGVWSASQQVRLLQSSIIDFRYRSFSVKRTNAVVVVCLFVLVCVFSFFLFLNLFILIIFLVELQ